MRVRRDLGLLLWGNGISTLGTSVYLVTVLLLLKDMTQSVFLLGLFQFVALIPGFLLSPFTGVLVDRTSRRSIIIRADLLRGVVMIGAALGLFLPGMRSPALVLAASALIGVGNAFFVPAAQALIPDLVPPEELQHANGARAASNQGFNLAGNALGGVLYSLLGAPLVFLLNGITFFLSALQETLIRAPRDRARRRAAGEALPRRGRRFFEDVLLGISSVTGSRTAITLFISQALLFLLSPVLLLSLPFIVIDELGYSGAMVGVCFAVSLAGGITAFLAAGRVSVEGLLRAPLVAISYGILAAAFVLLGTRVFTVTLLGASFFFGFGAGMVYLYIVTWIQVRNAPDLHGRLFSLLEAGNSLVAPVSYVTTGFVLEILGPHRRHWLFLLFAGVAAAWGVRNWLQWYNYKGSL